MRIALRSACPVLHVAFVPQGRHVRAGAAHRGARDDVPGRSPRIPFNPHDPQQAGYRLPWDRDTPPAQRPHAIPVAWIGADVDGNLDRSFCAGKGIKGAFWANYLSEIYLRTAGGAQAIGASLPGIRTEALHHAGLLVVATESPLPEDSEDNRQRFLAVHRALRPAFLSRAETAANQRALLGYFYREYLPGLP